MSPKEDLIGPLVRAIADEVERRLIPRLTRPMARLLTVEEAGAYLGRTPGAIRSMVKAGKIPYLKIDERLMFDVRDLDRMIDAAKGE